MWTVPATHAASGFTVAPSSGTGSGGVFTATFPDAPGFTGANPAWVQILFATSPSGATSFCLVHYDAGGNGLWLYGDNNFFVGPVTPGTDSAVLQNRSCVVNPAATTVTHTGGQLKVNLVAGFKPGFVGAQNVYLRSLDATGYKSRGSERCIAEVLDDLLPSLGSGLSAMDATAGGCSCQRRRADLLPGSLRPGG